MASTEKIMAVLYSSSGVNLPRLRVFYSQVRMHKIIASLEIVKLYICHIDNTVANVSFFFLGIYKVTD